MIDISPIQIMMVLAIALLVFGPRRLPELGRTLGRGIRELRGALEADPEPRDPGPPREASGRPATSEPPPAAAEDDLAGLVVPGEPPPEAGESPPAER